MVEEIECNGCGSTEWELVHEDSYPERKKSSDQTVREVWVCEDCGSEGRRFENGETGEVTFSGALRINDPVERDRQT